MHQATGLKFLFIMAFLVSLACQTKREDQSVARLDKQFVYVKDLEGIVAEGTTMEDSINVVRAYLDQWARQQLLYKQALKNLNTDQLAEIDKLVEQYKSDLTVKKYFENLIKSKIDTTITHREMVVYYNANRENFRNQQTLLQMRFIQVPKSHPKFELIASKFAAFSRADASFWDATQLQMKSSALNDSIWVDMNQVYQKLPFISPENKSKYLAANKSIRYEDSLDVFFVRINRMIEPNQISPYDYLKPTIKEILLNQKQQQFIKQFEKLIIQDAIKSKTYEIY